MIVQMSKGKRLEQICLILLQNVMHILLRWISPFTLNAAKKDPGDGRTKGVEVFVYSKNSKAYVAAERICKKIAALGFTNRGVKTSTGLYVLKHTHSPAMLIEVAFVDDKDDADLYRRVGVNAICKAIVEGILNKSVSISASEPASTIYGQRQQQNQRLNRHHLQLHRSQIR